jgi:hypothetical protein
MRTIKILTAALLLVAATSPVFAQAAIQEPGAFAFYHPSGDVLQTGVPVSTQTAFRRVYASVRSPRHPSANLGAVRMHTDGR